MSASLDLIDYFRINVSFDSTDRNITIETVETSDRAKGLRQIRTVKRWKRIKAIGRGSFGSVWLEHVDDNSETRRAVKEISKRNGTSMSVFNIDYNRELVALGRLSKHQDVFVDFYGWYENDQSVFLAMEYFNYGDLGQYITQDLTERDTQVIAKQLLEGLAILHQQNWAHRDLKPQNIFVVSPSPRWWVKIGDFGISKRLREDETRTNIGTLNYTAPEIMGYIDDGVDSEEEEHGRTEYTVIVDMWSLGCLLYQMLALTLPFPIPKKLANYCRSKKRNFPLGPLQQRLVSDEGCQCIQQLMTIEPSERLTASAALKTKWVSEVEHHDTAVGVQRAPSKRMKPNIEPLVRLGASHNFTAKPPSSQLIMESKSEFNMNSTALHKPPGSSSALKTDPTFNTNGTLAQGNTGSSLDTVDPSWRETLGELLDLGVTEDQIEENAGFIKSYIEQKQASKASAGPLDETSNGSTLIDKYFSLSKTEPVTAKGGTNQCADWGKSCGNFDYPAFIQQTDTSKPEQPNESTSSPQPLKDLLSFNEEEFRPGWAVALRDFFEKTKVGEFVFGRKLCVSRGDVLWILYQYGHNDWWMARGENQVIGSIPRNYVGQHSLVATPCISYKPEQNGDIELIQGHRITNITISSENWWTGTNHFGDRGLFPRNHVRLDLSQIGPAPI